MTASRDKALSDDEITPCSPSHGFHVRTADRQREAQSWCSMEGTGQAHLSAGHYQRRLLLALRDFLGESLRFWASAFASGERMGWADRSLRPRDSVNTGSFWGTPFPHIKSSPWGFLISVALRTTEPHLFFKRPVVLCGTAFSFKLGT